MKWVAHRGKRGSVSLNSINTVSFFLIESAVCPTHYALSERGLERIRYNAGGTAALKQPRDSQTSNPSISLKQPGKAEPSTDPIAQKFTRSMSSLKD